MDKYEKRLRDSTDNLIETWIKYYMKPDISRFSIREAAQKEWDAALEAFANNVILRDG